MTSSAPDTASADAVAIEMVSDGERLTVVLKDGRAVSVPLAWYPRLAFATDEERRTLEIHPGGDLLEWPLLNEVLPVTAVLEGRRSQESARSVERWNEKLTHRREALARGEAPEPWYPTLLLPDAG